MAATVEEIARTEEEIASIHVYQVGEQITRYGELVEELRDTVRDLEIRLSSVTKPEEEVGRSPAELSLVPLAEELQKLNCAVADIMEALQSLFRRIEL